MLFSFEEITRIRERMTSNNAPFSDRVTETLRLINTARELLGEREIRRLRLLGKSPEEIIRIALGSSTQDLKMLAKIISPSSPA